ncbi:MAG: histidine kinase dimerization/phospho-acceptor domain-containing protein [Verrucomicrobiota bacterium]
MTLSEEPPEESLPWKQIVAQTVHDMRTPLSTMRATVEILRMTSEKGGDQSKLIGSLDTQIDELAAQLETLLKSPQEIVHFTTLSRSEADL